VVYPRSESLTNSLAGGKPPFLTVLFKAVLSKLFVPETTALPKQHENVEPYPQNSSSRICVLPQLTQDALSTTPGEIKRTMTHLHIRIGTSLLVLFTLINTTLAYPARVQVALTDMDFSELDKLVPGELQDRNTPGAVIAIVMGDRVVYQKAFGLTNVETNAPMQTDMLFRLGSTTKMFTAAAMVSLAGQDKIKLDKPIGNHVKGLSPKIAQATPNYLLSNSAGVRDFAAPFISNDDEALAKMVRSWKDDVFFADQGEIEW
jgi:Beta-lactamase